MKTLTDEQRDAMIEIVNECYSALYDLQSLACRLCHMAPHGSREEYEAESVNHHFELARQFLEDLGNDLDGVDDEEDDEYADE